MQSCLEDQFIGSYSVCGLYQITHKIAGGSTGTEPVMRGFNILTGEEVAVKLTPRYSMELFFSRLRYEALIYELIPRGTEGFVDIHYAGPDGGHRVLVMDKLGPTLEDLRHMCRGTFSFRTICMLADQMLSRLEFLHSRGVVCCDVKPHNFAMGMGKKAAIVHLFDFGHSKMYVDHQTGEHIPFQPERHAVGTIRYASVAAHDKHEVSRCDDINSLLYVLLEFYHGKLPWKGIFAPSWSEKVRLIRKMKADTSRDGAFQTMLARSPPEFAAYHAHCTELASQYGAAPDYALLRGLFRERMHKEGWAYDEQFDWMDGARRRQGTLLPEEYVVDMEFVEEKEWNPLYMSL
ncbi:kinase-like protein [Trametes maxima]|nr:kinase-like protein [Trametes maxima]